MSIQTLKDSLSSETAALIFSEENILYFTGFHSSNGVLLVTDQKALFFTDGRYIEAAQKSVHTCDGVLLLESFDQSVLPVLTKEKCKTVLVEGERLSFLRVERLSQKLSCNVDAAMLDEKIRSIRKVKTQAETNAILRAQRIAEQALEIIKPKIKTGACERELALELDFTMLRLGAQAISFDTILISGKETSMPHGVPTEKPIARGDFVTIDFGAVVDGYHSDMTRTFAVGAVSDKQRTVYETVLQAQEAAIAALGPGRRCKEIDAISRDIIQQAGYGACFTHSLGHGVGIEIHEFPVLSPKSEETLAEGHVVTVEPGIYLPGEFGVRIEDMGMITKNGFYNFTKANKTLEIL